MGGLATEGECAIMAGIDVSQAQGLTVAVRRPHRDRPISIGRNLYGGSRVKRLLSVHVRLSEAVESSPVHAFQSRPQPRGGSISARASRSRSMIACGATAVTLSRNLSGSASNHAAHSAWTASISAKASSQRRGWLRRSTGLLYWLRVVRWFEWFWCNLHWRSTRAAKATFLLRCQCGVPDSGRTSIFEP